MHIRLATPADCTGIAQVFQAAFSPFKHQYTPDAYASTAVGEADIKERMEAGLTWVADENGKIIGTVTVVEFWEGMYVTGMALLPDAQGKRVAYGLMKALEDWVASQGAKRIYLYTTTFLHRAIALYEKFGFTRYGDPEDEFMGTQLIQFEKMLTANHNEENTKLVINSTH